MAFKEGNKHGKGAPKKEKRVGNAIIRALGRKFEKLENGLDMVAEALIDIAVDKNHPQQMKAITEIRDTLDGRPPQAIVGDSDHDPITHTVSWKTE